MQSFAPIAQLYNTKPFPEHEPELSTEGSFSLFTGHNLDDWSFVGSGDFVVEHGALMSRGKTGLLWYKHKRFGNCVVRVLYKVNDPETSSAVFVCIPEAPKDIWEAVHHSHQIKICDSQDEYRRTGSIYSMSRARLAKTKPPGEWNTMDIFLKGKRVAVYINQELISEFNPLQTSPPRAASSDPLRGPRPEAGFVGLLNHNDPINDIIGRVWFKDISVLPLPAQM